MIPIVPIGKFIAAGIAAFLALHAYKRWTKTKNITLYYFFKFLAWMAITFVSFVPLAFFKNLYVIQGILYWIDFASFLALANLYSMIFLVLGWEKFHKHIYWIVVASGILTISAYALYFTEALTYSYPLDGFTAIGWAANLPHFLRAAIIILCLVTILTFCPLLLKSAAKYVDPYIKRRGILLSLGLFVLVGAGIVYFGIGIFVTVSFWKDIFHVFFSILGAIIFYLAIFYKKPVQTKAEEIFSQINANDKIKL